jgi:hypothetical protein
MSEKRDTMRRETHIGAGEWFQVCIIISPYKGIYNDDTFIYW